MENMNDYVQIMIESLMKKSLILDRLIQMNKNQAECVKGENFDDINWNKFNIIVSEKEAEIERIQKMDEGFQAVYDRLGEQIKANKDEYAEQIKAMQALITELEEKSVKIRTGEERNRVQIEKIIAGRKKDIKKARTSLKAATSYYSAMQKPMELGPSALDKKK